MGRGRGCGAGDESEGQREAGDGAGLDRHTPSTRRSGEWLGPGREFEQYRREASSSARRAEGTRLSRSGRHDGYIRPVRRAARAFASHLDEPGFAHSQRLLLRESRSLTSGESALARVVASAPRVQPMPAVDPYRPVSLWLDQLDEALTPRPSLPAIGTPTSRSSAPATPGCGPPTTCWRSTPPCEWCSWSPRSPASARPAATAAGARRSSPPPWPRSRGWRRAPGRPTAAKRRNDCSGRSTTSSPTSGASRRPRGSTARSSRAAT